MGFDGSSEITNSADIIDSREIIARLDYLKPFKVVKNGSADEYEDEFATRDEAQEYIDELPDEEIDDFEVIEYAEESDELKALQAFADEASNSADDWDNGAGLIRESYFVEYARQYADDIRGNEIGDAGWPFNHIDWDAAADDFKTDYSAVTFDGVTYWVR